MNPGISINVTMIHIVFIYYLLSLKEISLNFLSFSFSSSETSFSSDPIYYKDKLSSEAVYYIKDPDLIAMLRLINKNGIKINMAYKNPFSSFVALTGYSYLNK